MSNSKLEMLKFFDTDNRFLGDGVWCEDPKIFPALDRIHHAWDEAKLWVFKFNYDAKIKPNIACKKHGVFLNRLFLLIERIVSFDKEGITIDSWNKCCADLMQMDFLDCFYGIKPIEKSWVKGYLCNLRQNVKQLRTNQNPFTHKKIPNQVISHYIDRGIFYKNDSTPFYKDYWKPFIASYSAYVTDLDKNTKYKMAYLVGDTYFISTGKGKSPKKRYPVDKLLEDMEDLHPLNQPLTGYIKYQ